MEHFILNGKKFVLEDTRQYWRVNHDSTFWRPNLPEVFPFEPNHHSFMTRAYQLMSKAINPTMTNQKWRTLYADTTAFTNNQGFEKAGDPRADFVNGLNLSSPLPKQEALICGGAILLERKVLNGYLYPVYIDATKLLPTAAFVLANPHLYFDALSVDQDFLGNIVLRRFPQGAGQRVYVPFLANREIKIPLHRVSRLPNGIPFPSPYQYP